jgi:hypothetical protein
MGIFWHSPIITDGADVQLERFLGNKWLVMPAVLVFIWVSTAPYAALTSLRQVRMSGQITASSFTGAKVA